MIVACSMVLSALSQLQATLARSGLLAFSEGQWLTLVRRYVYGVARIPATFAAGEVVLSNGGGGVFSFDPNDLIFSNPATGQTYRNTASVTLNPLSSATVAVQATVAGSDGSAGVGEITQMTTVVLGVSVTNLSPLTGTDEERDAALRQRGSEKLGALSPFGPWDAYAFAVRSAVRGDDSSLGINRIRLVKDGFGTVTTCLAGTSGAIAGDPEDPDTDLGIANEAIQRKAAPVHVNAVVVSAVNKVIAVTCEIWMRDTSSLSDAQIENVIREAIESFFDRQPIGGNVIGSDPGRVFATSIQAAIYDSMDEIFRVSVTVPAADVALDPDEVPVRGTVSVIAIHREPAAGEYGAVLKPRSASRSACTC